jgi:hypothetical protein
VEVTQLQPSISTGMVQLKPCGLTTFVTSEQELVAATCQILVLVTIAFISPVFEDDFVRRESLYHKVRDVEPAIDGAWQVFLPCWIHYFLVRW